MIKYRQTYFPQTNYFQNLIGFGIQSSNYIPSVLIRGSPTCNQIYSDPFHPLCCEFNINMFIIPINCAPMSTEESQFSHPNWMSAK